MKMSISIPDDLFQTVTDYCNENGFKLSTLIQHLLKQEIGIKNKKDLKVIEKLMDKDPDADTLEGEELGHLAKIVVKQEKVLFPSSKETVHTQNVGFNKVGEIIKKVKKSEFCPHMISVEGNCRKCVESNG